MKISIYLLRKRPLKIIDYLRIQYNYLVLSKFKSVRLETPNDNAKGVILSFDVETWSNTCGGRLVASADPEDEYFRYLPELLDLLDEYSIKAHFFVCGKVLELYHEAFSAVLRKGHGVGGHGYVHEIMSSLPIEEQRKIIRKVGFLMHERLGTELRSWRCPRLAANLDTYKALKESDVRFASNTQWGKPMFIEGVLEVPIAGKMDGEILGYYERKNVDQEKWADYLKEKFDRTSSGILVIGMHTWIQKKKDPKCEALRRFLDYLEPYKSKVWFGRFDDLRNYPHLMV